MGKKKGKLGFLARSGRGRREEADGRRWRRRRAARTARCRWWSAAPVVVLGGCVVLVGGVANGNRTRKRKTAAASQVAGVDGDRGWFAGDLCQPWVSGGAWWPKLRERERSAARGERRRRPQIDAGAGWVVPGRPVVARRAAGQRSGGSGAAGGGRRRPVRGERVDARQWREKGSIGALRDVLSSDLQSMRSRVEGSDAVQEYRHDRSDIRPVCSMLRRRFSCSLSPFLSHQQRYPQKGSLVRPPLRSLYSLRFPIISQKVLSMAEQASNSSSQSQRRYSNRLASEHSPYLLQHAHNPVNWYPWGEAAFEEAKKRDAPIFLSIGYSTCHWCHVMEVESFENEEVAKLLNDWFISIKVDREERPDVDKVYMTYVQALYGGGGWPLSVFLSPDLKPLMGGTYFPPDDQYGRPGFKTVLRKVKEAWDKKRDMLLKSGAFAIEQLSEALFTKASSDKLPDGLPQHALNLCAEQLSKSFDPVYGGFGSAPKFPRPVEIQLMLYHSRTLEESGSAGKANDGFQMVYFSLQCMARGGIHDHVGGGFHRYSVDECWHVPHFEKMLYDQGQLTNVYLDAFSITKNLHYSTVARDILDYLRRDMIGPDGEIFSAEDADSAETEGDTRKKEGAFYIWTSKEVDSILGEHAPLFKEHYSIKPSGNCDLSRLSDPHNEFKGRNVLIERNSTEALASKLGMHIQEYLEILGTCRRKLFDARSKRPRPHLDDKVIVSWNGLAISSFARASKILEGEPEEMKFYFPVTGCNPKEYIKVADKAASFIREHLYNEEIGRLQHSFRKGPSKAPGFLDDYAFLISGLLDLFEYGGDTIWLSWAAKLQDTQDELFMDEDGGGYFNTPGEDPSILLRVKEDHDGAEPSGNSVSVINLIRLASIFSSSRSKRYRLHAERLLAAFETRLKDMAMAVPLMCCGANMLTVPSRKQVVLVGQKPSGEFENMLAAAHRGYDPNKTVIHIDPTNAEEMKFWEENNPGISLMARNSFSAEKVVALVCRNFACSPPITDPLSLQSLLSKKAPSSV